MFRRKKRVEFFPYVEKPKPKRKKRQTKRVVVTKRATLTNPIPSDPLSVNIGGIWLERPR